MATATRTKAKTAVKMKVEEAYILTGNKSRGIEDGLDSKKGEGIAWMSKDGRGSNERGV